MVGVLAVGFLARQDRDAGAVCVALVLRAARVHHPHADAARRPPAAAACLLRLPCPLQYWLIGIDWYGTVRDLHPGVRIPAAARGADARAATPRVPRTQQPRSNGALMITVYCISHAPALLLLRIPGYEGQNALLLFYLLLVVQLSDVLQYVFGKLFGKHQAGAAGEPFQDRGRTGRRRLSAATRSARRCGGSRRSPRCRRWHVAS